MLTQDQKTIIDIVVEHGRDVLEAGSFYAIHDFVVLVETHYLRGVDSDTRGYYDEVGFWDVYHACQVLDFENLSTLSAVKVLGHEVGRLLDLEWHEIRRKMDYYFMRFSLKDEVRAHQEVLLRSLLQSTVQLTQSNLAIGDAQVEPTISNWFKYYYSYVGGQNNVSELKTAEFLVKDTFVQQLNKNDVKRLKNLLDLQEHLRLTPEELTEYGSTILVGTGYDGEFLAVSNGSASLLQTDEAKQARAADERELERIAQELDHLNTPKPKRRSLRSQEPKALPELKPISTALEPETVKGEQVNTQNIEYSQEIARLPEVNAHVLPQLARKQVSARVEPVAQEVVVEDILDEAKLEDQGRIIEKPAMEAAPVQKDEPIDKVADDHALMEAPANLPIAVEDIPHELMVAESVKQAVHEDVDTREVLEDSSGNEDREKNLPKNDSEGLEENISHPAPNPLEQKVQKLYIGNPSDNAYIYERALRTEGVSKAQAIETLINSLQMKDVKGTVGALIGLARLGVLEKDLVHDVRMVGFLHGHFQDIPKFDKIPISASHLIELLRLLLETFLVLSEHESARYGAHIGNAYSEKGSEVYSDIAHFDVDEGAFLWDSE